MIVSSIENAWPAGKAWCFLTGFFTSNMLGASMLTLAVISFDRLVGRQTLFLVLFNS